LLKEGRSIEGLNQWLFATGPELAHKKLDAAVFAAYGWKSDLSDKQILEKLLSLLPPLCF
jgi:hypothetical protein